MPNFVLLLLSPLDGDVKGHCLLRFEQISGMRYSTNAEIVLIRGSSKNYKLHELQILVSDTLNCHYWLSGFGINENQNSLLH